MPGWMGPQLQNPFIGPTYPLNSRVGSVARTVNMAPRPLEPGNERTDWVFEDTIGLTAFSTVNNIVASFIWTNALMVFSFVDTSQIGPVSWSWTFGDAGTSTDQNPTHTFLTNNTFTVTLTVTNAAGKSSTVSHDVTVTGAPHAGLLFADFSSTFGLDTTALPVTPSFTVGGQANVVGDGWWQDHDATTADVSVNYSEANSPLGPTKWDAVFAPVSTGLPWSIEWNARWLTLPAASNSFMVFIGGAAGTLALGFYGTAGHLGFGSSDDLGAGSAIPGGNVITSIAIQARPDLTQLQLFINGVFNQVLGTSTNVGLMSYVRIGRISYQGDANYGVKDVWLRAGINYTHP